MTTTLERVYPRSFEGFFSGGGMVKSMMCEVGTVVEAYNLVSHMRWGSDVVYGMFPLTVVAPMVVPSLLSSIIVC